MDVSIDLYGRQINVDAQNMSLDQMKAQAQQEKTEYLAQQGMFPDIGTIFALNNQLFKITYVNQGRKRISAEWYNDRSQPFCGLPEVDSSCSIHGKIYKVTFYNESRRRITIEPVD